MRFLSFGSIALLFLATIAGHADTYQLFNINGSGVYPTPGPFQGQTDTVSGTVVVDLTSGAFYNLTGSALGPTGELLSGNNPFEFRFLTNSLVGYTGSGFQMVRAGTQLFLFGSVTPSFDTIGVFDFTLTQVPGDVPVAKKPITGFTIIDTTSGTVELIDVKGENIGGSNGENISGAPGFGFLMPTQNFVGYTGSPVSYNPSYDLTYSDVFLGNAVEVSQNTPVPEPGTLVLLGTGLVGLAGTVRRRLANVTPRS